MTTPQYYMDALSDPIFWDKFWSRTRPGRWGCIDWVGSRNRGYGQASYSGKLLVAHRIAWIMFYGVAVPDGLVVDHLCCHKGCVNPTHLEAVSDSVNSRRWTEGRDGWFRMKNGRCVQRDERALYTATGRHRRGIYS